MKKTIGVITGIFIAAIVLSVFYVLFSKNDDSDSTFAEDETKTLYFWYFDEKLTDYLSSVALSYYNEKGVKVVPVYHSEYEYLNAIGEASLSSNEVPDMYILGTEEIEKAAMAGLALPVIDQRNVLSSLYYPKTALNAVSYKEEYWGYPLYFETSFLLYNETYLKQLAAGELKSELAKQLSEAESVSSSEVSEEDEGMSDIQIDDDIMSLPEGATQEAWENAIEERVKYFIPDSIQTLLSIASSHSLPSSVVSMFCWDVSDIYYNYFFAGAYMNIAGTYGDDRSVIDISNEDTVYCMDIYKSLNQYFSIDSTNCSYDKLIDDFINGDYIYMVASSDVISKLEKAKEEGSFKYEYNVAKLPSVDSEHKAKGLSSTKAVIINGFSENQTIANDFATYLTYNNASALYERTGKMAVLSSVNNYDAKQLSIIRDIYEESASLPKIVELSNFWLKLEQAYNLIWNGEDSQLVLDTLSEDIKSQIKN